MPGYAHPEYLVDTAWLAAHLGDPGVVVLDATTHLIPEPGAGYSVLPGRASPNPATRSASCSPAPSASPPAWPASA
jgi:hypothetical protein